MAIDDDLFPLATPVLRPAGHTVGSDISALSEAEIEERIAQLSAEIERLTRALEAKRASRSAAENFFKR
ncbi:DUF1192 domain-containing protein [Ancylobacter dichloromethanicus]|uniref:DUF1192 domain-containing protein n=1 Tax=Ancylobacter dichloromethanicus TaxID=518825 RepID=A0A9W6MXW0_9HYPH|nr:DUF1192 domain-containing protein [Ancylobacter dichloromethanicus]MBS7555301.1 DUF1192 domain-containing protein [Ancylobacter dichloromethanicus]GLK70483.1 hypothetical protein GCM10017643_05980 [Ancylobacter dichloromethanicus]